MKARVNRILTIAIVMSLATVTVFGAGSTEEVAEVDWNETGLPIVNEPFTLSVVSSHQAETPADHNELLIFQELEERTGITIDWISFDATAGDVPQRIQLLMASGDLPDIIRNGVDRQVMYEYGQQGLVIPQRELATKYAPNIWEVVEREPAFLQNSVAPDGNIYGWGRTPPLGADAPITHYINRTWLDRLGLDMPTTTAEFRDVLTAFRDRDANGNGDPSDEIPLSTVWKGVRWWANDYVLMGAFGNPGNYATPYLAMDDDGRPYYVLASETFRDFTSYMHGLVRDGLADSELYTQEWQTLVAKGNQQPPIVGSTFSWIGQPEIVAGESGSQYEALGPLTGPNGTRSYVYNGSRRAIGGYAFAITRDAQYPEIAMRWINEMYEPQFNLQKDLGPIGVTIELVNDNQIRLLPVSGGATEDSRKNSNALGGESNFIWRDFYEWEPSPQSRTVDAIRDKVEPAFPVANNWPVLFLTPDQQEEVQGLTDNIVELSERRWAGWVMNGGVEEEWDEYLAQLEELGLQDYLDTYYAAKVAAFGSD